MPLYDIRCGDCGLEGEAFRPIAKRHELPPCACGGAYAIVIRPPMVRSDIEPYRAVAVDIATGKPPVITSRSAHREFLKRNGYVEIGNERPKPKPGPKLGAAERDVARAIEQVKSGAGERGSAAGVNIFADIGG